jgi:hypothetical protein
VDFGKRKVEVEYFNVQKDAGAMKAFLALSSGDRRVPLIEEAGKVTIGFGGT